MIGVKATVSALIPLFFVDEETISLAGDIVIAGIKRRTLRGRSYTGRTFRPYAPSYVASGATDTAAPDLHVTGRMLSTLAKVQTGLKLRIVATATYAARVNKLRPFMGPAREDATAITAMARRRATVIMDRGELA